MITTIEQEWFSRADLLRNIKLPDDLTPELAELVGVIIGDGHIDCRKYKTTSSNSILISGSLKEDMDFYKDRINPLFFKLFNIRFTFTSARDDELIVRLYSKAIVHFMNRLGVPSGNKTYNNQIPKLILDSDESIKKSFLRGLFDTDGGISFKKYKGFHSRPIISLTMKSKLLAEQVQSILLELGFFPRLFMEERYYAKRNKSYSRHRIELAGKEVISKFVGSIGFSNPRNFNKVKIWKKFGFYPPRLSHAQRMEILEGKLDPCIFYN